MATRTPASVPELLQRLSFNVPSANASDSVKFTIFTWPSGGHHDYVDEKPPERGLAFLEDTIMVVLALCHRRPQPPGGQAVASDGCQDSELCTWNVAAIDLHPLG
ncbi:hypothetical protein AVEN_119982-1 [Araneus ventricosus]|uniref:Uncharacterized protein n=1 Tax=Araneus ventricosus TaxID=182803 RepID=A0A4Y2QKY0_ARAVE|nr:hypothetical protein AVEN_119982-1 [Araneus ventricosus]